MGTLHLIPILFKNFWFARSFFKFACSSCNCFTSVSFFLMCNAWHNIKIMIYKYIYIYIHIFIYDISYM